VSPAATPPPTTPPPLRPRSVDPAAWGPAVAIPPEPPPVRATAGSPPPPVGPFRRAARRVGTAVTRHPRLNAAVMLVALPVLLADAYSIGSDHGTAAEALRSEAAMRVEQQAVAHRAAEARASHDPTDGCRYIASGGLRWLDPGVDGTLIPVPTGGGTHCTKWLRGAPTVAVGFDTLSKACVRVITTVGGARWILGSGEDLLPVKDRMDWGPWCYPGSPAPIVEPER
jgi:hypothetical protein